MQRAASETASLEPPLRRPFLCSLPFPRANVHSPGSTAVFTSQDMRRIRRTLAAPKASGPSMKAEQHRQSAARAATWGNTIEAMSKKKIQDKLDREAEAEVR